MQKLEEGITYYHSRFNLVLGLFAEGKDEDLRKGKEKIIKLLKEYEKRFKGEPDFSQLYVIMVKDVYDKINKFSD